MIAIAILLTLILCALVLAIVLLAEISTTLKAQKPQKILIQRSDDDGFSDN